MQNLESLTNILCSIVFILLASVYMFFSVKEEKKRTKKIEETNEIMEKSFQEFLEENARPKGE